jgi:hypothetical protein
VADESRQRRRARERAAIQSRVHGKIAKAVTVFDMWTTFRGEVLQEITNPIQIEETRRGFYAGAAAMLDLIVRVTPDDVSEDQGVEMLEALHQELRAFGTDMRQT